MKKIMSLFLLIVILATTFQSNIKVSAKELTTPSGISSNKIGDELDDYVEKFKAGLASCEVAVFDANGIITSKYYGFSDIEHQVKANEETVYDWGSCSKLLVWVSVMQQWERGNINLDADIREYLPDGFLTKLQYKDEKITMKHIMSHNAGFQESFYENQECGEDELFPSLKEALKTCECYQAYHVGQYTAYSNYGTALAAYVVECVSGETYTDYVRKNIFEPLGMKHTSIDPHMNDNEYVKRKRNELKCYYRGADRSDDEDYGTCISWVQLFPAGSAIGTLDDFAKFGSAFVAKDCPLFENDSTRDIMYTPTSYYGDSDVAKNCHGLWTDECKIQILGHGGNTSGCSSMLKFDPDSSFGVVMMTNEPGETVFNYGITNLLFGEVTDRPEYAKRNQSDENDISGIYLSKRTIDSGAMCFQKYIGGLFPWSKNDKGSYDMKLFGFDMAPDNELIKVADHQYIFDNNGMKMFMYHSYDKDGNSKLEMMSTDYVMASKDKASMLFFVGIFILGIVCVIILVVKFIVSIIRKIRKKEKRYCKQIIVSQLIYAITVIILVLFISISIGNSYGFTRISSILASTMGVLAFINGTILCYNTIKNKEINRLQAVNRYIWSILSITYFIFIITFQFYNFWDL